MAQSAIVPAAQLKVIISQTLVPDANIRKTAEKQLQDAQKTPRHPLEVLQLVADANAADAAVRQAAAVHFKNTIKKGWDVNREDGNEGIVITQEERNTIKSHLVQLMLTVPPQIQVQISESISLVAQVDYPQNWDNLLPELVQQFNSTDPAVLIGVLKTLNTIFKRFRYVQRNDDLYRVILYTLERIQAPFLALFKKTGQAVDAFANDPHQLKPRLEALRIMCRIFWSLNYQDLPEFFEDHMGEFMAEFTKYLQYQNPAMIDESEEVTPSPIDELQTAIIENLALYADKDEEAFLEYLPKFTSLVWNLLMNVTAYSKHDKLATTSIRFLSSLVQKLMHRDLFKDEATLRQIVLKIVIPNLKFRESDEEKFEDDPREYIVTEVEGSDSESRRKCSQDLLRAMCRQFENETTAICSEHVGSMLAEYAAAPNQKWASKDAAIHLMMGISIRRESILGVSEVNSAVNVMEFFHTHILPELQDTNHSSRPVVKATAIKFVSVFRKQFSKENLVQLLPLLVGHLGSPIVVVHTFAAYALERILFTKVEVAGGAKASPIGSAELQTILEPLFTSLFSIIDNQEHNENDYVMKCVMRSLVTAGEAVISVTDVVISKLTAALGRVAKNPKNPQFNHYLFESIAVLVRSVCSKDPNATSRFEALLFEPFTVILQMDIAEFTPYVFQILAQLLEYRPAEAGLGEAFESLFQPLLSASPWEKRGNVPALSRLMQAYIRKAAPALVAHLTPILGVFQLLLSVKATEIQAFEILTSSTVHFPQEAIEPKLNEILRLLLFRLQNSKTPRYTKLATTYFALIIGKFGPQLFLDRLNGQQAGLAMMVLTYVWNPALQENPPSERIEAKVQVVGLTRLLCETPALLTDDNTKQVWSSTLTRVVMLLTSTTFTSTTEHVAEDEIEIGYDAQFSQLKFAVRTKEDPFPEVVDPTTTFVQSLHRLLSGHPEQLVPWIQHGLGDDQKLVAGLENMFQKAGLRLA